MSQADKLRRRARRAAHQVAIKAERAWDSSRASRRAGRTPLPLPPEVAEEARGNMIIISADASKFFAIPEKLPYNLG